MDALDLEALRRTRGIDLAVWPPRYASAPRPEEACGLREIECAPAAARDELILAKLRRQVAYASERCPFYQRKWDAAGVSPDTLQSLEDLGRFPVVQNAETRLAQAAHPPFGDYLGIEAGDIARIHGTSGTTGRPTGFGIGRGGGGGRAGQP